MATIASLSVLLDLNYSGFTGGLSNALKNMEAFEVSINNLNRHIRDTQGTVFQLQKEQHARSKEIFGLQNDLRSGGLSSGEASQGTVFQLQKEQHARSKEIFGLQNDLRSGGLSSGEASATRTRIVALREERLEVSGQIAGMREEQRLRRQEVSDTRQQTSQLQSRFNVEERIADQKNRIQAKLDNRLEQESRNTFAGIEKARKQASREEQGRVREELQGQQERRAAILGVSRGLGHVANAAAAAAGTMRNMMTFAGGRIAGGVGKVFDSLAHSIGAIIGPSEAVGGAVRTLIGGSFTAVGHVIGSFGDFVGTVISGVSISIGKLAGGLLGLVPMLGPLLGGLANMLGELGGAIGAAVGAGARIFGEVLGGVGRVAGEIVGGLVSLGVHAVVTAAKFESLQLSMEVMTGSAAQAKAIMKDIFAFAARTPLEVMDVGKATQMFMAVGIGAERALEMVKKLSNISAAMPGDMAQNLQHVVRALAQMHAKGTVQSEEMTRQLANAGIPAWEALAERISKVLGRTISVAKAMDLVKHGAIPASEAIQAMLDLADSPLYAGMNERRAQTMTGLWSTLKDNVTFLMIDIGNAITKEFDLKGTADQLTNFIGYLQSSIGSLTPAIELIGTAFQAAFGIALDLIRLAVEEFKDWTGQINGAPKGLTEMRDAIIDVMEAIAISTVVTLTTIANKAIDVINRIKSPLGGITEGGLGMAGQRVGLGLLRGFQDIFGQRGTPFEKWLNKTIVETAPTGQGDIAHLSSKGVVSGIRQKSNDLRNIPPIPPSAVQTFNALGAAIGGVVMEATRLARTAESPEMARFGNLWSPASPGSIVGGMAASALIMQRHMAAIGQADEMGLEGKNKFKLGEFTKEMTKAFNDAMGPFDKFKKKLEDLNDTFLLGMAGHKAFAKSLRDAPVVGTIFGGGVLRAAEGVLAYAETARRRLAAKDFLDARKHILAPAKDLPALEAGSKEAVGAMNKAYNEERTNNQTVEQDLAAIRAFQEKGNEFLDKIANAMINAGALAVLKN